MSWINPVSHFNIITRVLISERIWREGEREGERELTM
jgi:hypothetical protein